MSAHIIWIGSISLTLSLPPPLLFPFPFPLPFPLPLPSPSLSLFHLQNSRTKIVCTTLISYRRYCTKIFPYKNFVRAEILKLYACCTVIYLYAALLFIHKQTHVDARQALNCSINMCYMYDANELRKVLHGKVVNGK